jgi:hypothetical protein
MRGKERLRESEREIRRKALYFFQKTTQCGMMELCTRRAGREKREKGE